MDAVSESKNPRLLVMVDEYDRFANKLMVEDLPAYDGVVTGVAGDPFSSSTRLSRKVPQG
jgi:hypothetical protein